MRWRYEDDTPSTRNEWAEFVSDIIVMVALATLFAAVVFGVASL